MFIEVTEVLRCPRPHDEAYMVCVPVVSDGRRVVRGGLGCPVCGAEYPILDGIAHFGPAPAPPAATDDPAYDAEALLAFVDLQGRGGYVVLAGRAGRHGAALAALLDGVHVCAVNPPAEVRPSAGVSVLVAPDGLPVKTRAVRASALGRDASGAPWLAEAVRILLPGLRLVVEDDAANPEDIDVLARGAGLLVGRKRSR